MKKILVPTLLIGLLLSACAKNDSNDPVLPKSSTVEVSNKISNSKLEYGKSEIQFDKSGYLTAKLEMNVISNNRKDGDKLQNAICQVELRSKASFTVDPNEPMEGVKARLSLAVQSATLLQSHQSSSDLDENNVKKICESYTDGLRRQSTFTLFVNSYEKSYLKFINLSLIVFDQRSDVPLFQSTLNVGPDGFSTRNELGELSYFMENDRRTDISNEILEDIRGSFSTLVQTIDLNVHFGSSDEIEISSTLCGFKKNFGLYYATLSDGAVSLFLKQSDSDRQKTIAPTNFSNECSYLYETVSRFESASVDIRYFISPKNKIRRVILEPGNNADKNIYGRFDLR